MLARECCRLVPVKNEAASFYNFHPLNMPKNLIQKVQIIGMIVNIITGNEQLEIDGKRRWLIDNFD